MSDQIEVNGSQFSWGSIEVKLDGEVFTGFTKIAYGDSRERTKAYGMGRHHAPRGRSRGKYATDPVQLTGWKGSVQTLREALASKSADGNSYGDVEFEITVSYIEADETPMLVEIRRCVWAKSAASNEEGPDPLSEEIEIDCMFIVRNGKTLYEPRPGDAQ